MISRNDITGDAIRSKTSSLAYYEGYDLIFSKKKDKETKEVISEEKNSFRDL